MTQTTQIWLVRIVIAVMVVGAVYLLWQTLQPDGPPDGFASGNGRIEATEIDIATKIAGRVEAIEVGEGDFVTKGQILAVMDTEVLDAQLREAEAELQRAKVGVETAQSQVSQREAEKAAAEASVAQRKAELDAAQKRLARAEELVPKGATSIQVLDDRRAEFEGAKAAVAAAEAQVSAAEAAIGLAKSQVISARAAVDAAQASIHRIKAEGSAPSKSAHACVVQLIGSRHGTKNRPRRKTPSRNRIFGVKFLCYRHAASAEVRFGRIKL